jgi:hypothetical protein
MLDELPSRSFSFFSSVCLIQNTEKEMFHKTIIDFFLFYSPSIFFCLFTFSFFPCYLPNLRLGGEMKYCFLFVLNFHIVCLFLLFFTLCCCSVFIFSSLTLSALLSVLAFDVFCSW